MINADMREYDYFTYTQNEYGQTVVSPNALPVGKIKMAIYTTSQTAQDNVLYKNASYMGLTHETEVNDTYQIDFNGERLKVLYVGSQGRLRQVFMSRVG